MTDPPKPDITKAVARGDLASVRRIVDAAAAVSHDERIKTVNAARKWTEVHPAYKSEENPSGCAEWHDVTPVTVAAIRGHDDVVEYLLRQGADPTLKGCPKDDLELDEHVPVIDMPEVHVNAFDAAGRLNRKIRCCRRTQDLLMMVKPYWKRCVYSGSSAARHKRTIFSNVPLNIEWIMDGLAQVPPGAQEYPLKAQDYNEDMMLDSNYWRKRKLIEMEQIQAQQRATAPPVPEPIIEPGVSGRNRRCFACGELKPEFSYNKNERRRGVEARCISCVATNAGVLDMANAMCTICRLPKFNENSAVCQRCLARMAGESNKPPAAKSEMG